MTPSPSRITVRFSTPPPEGFEELGAWLRTRVKETEPSLRFTLEVRSIDREKSGALRLTVGVQIEDSVSMQDVDETARKFERPPCSARRTGIDAQLAWFEIQLRAPRAP